MCYSHNIAVDRRKSLNAYSVHDWFAITFICTNRGPEIWGSMALRTWKHSALLVRRTFKQVSLSSRSFCVVMPHESLPRKSVFEPRQADPFMCKNLSRGQQYSRHHQVFCLNEQETTRSKGRCPCCFNWACSPNDNVGFDFREILEWARPCMSEVCLGHSVVIRY